MLSSSCSLNGRIERENIRLLRNRAYSLCVLLYR
jgi:hypothetical protein